jgi:3-hydroxybutyrate dehydrogenase
MSMKGKTVLVTGSTSGIGLGVAEAFAAEGANLVLNGFGDANEIEKLRAGIEARHGIKAVYIGADMSKPDQIAAMVVKAEKQFGAVDVLVNNAGIQHTAPIEEFPLDRWDAVIAINLSSSFHTIRAALPAMKKKGWGRIVNIASAHGLVASRDKSAYVAAKHGVVGLTKAAALDYATRSIRVNAVAPGLVATPMTERWLADPAFAGKLLQNSPIGRAAQPEEIAGTVLHLCSSAASFITGQTFVVDGGQTAH